MKKIRLHSIKWDTDGEKVSDLPEAVIAPFPESFDIENEGADWLSDAYGFCVEGFLFEAVE